MKTYKTMDFEVTNGENLTLAQGSFTVATDTNYHPSILREQLREKCRQLAETFWDGTDTTCRLHGWAGEPFSYCHSEK